MRARRGAFGMVVVEFAPIAQPHVLLPQPAVPVANLFGKAAIEHRWDEDMFIPRSGMHYWINANVKNHVHVGKLAEPELTPDELRKMKEYEAARESQPWGWAAGPGGMFGAAGRVFMSVTGPRWRCCGNRFEDEHSPWCSIEGFTDPFPERP